MCKIRKIFNNKSNINNPIKIKIYFFIFKNNNKKKYYKKKDYIINKLMLQN